MSHATETRWSSSGGAGVRRVANREPFSFIGTFHISWGECTLVRIHLQSPNANTSREIANLASQTWTCPGSPEEHQGDTQIEAQTPPGLLKENPHLHLPGEPRRRGLPLEAASK